MAWALIDPNWGEPKVVLATIRDTFGEAVQAAIFDPESSLYSGAQLHCIPPRPGTISSLTHYGYRIALVDVVILP